eukprot:TRINITY_DN16651_c0_g1_i1.p1 TRINITY_DN16651_c0_g1~~TRINITY_DN16651_c0_g1_i1.p1  ORF type:complete len:287 (+),score=74.15 TRINITY_DN16651_c0_g1_i1:55-861(+)
MVYSLEVACDLFGRKHNRRLRFPQRPTLVQLRNAVVSVYDTVTRVCRPCGYPDEPFRVAGLQLYCPNLLRWVDVASESQLRDGLQLFAHQPDSMWHSDAQGVIPAAKDVLTWTLSERAVGHRFDGSKRTARCVTAPSLQRRAFDVFGVLDAAGAGRLSYSDLRGGLLRAGIELTDTGAPQLFHSADADADGALSPSEWLHFASRYPDLIDALYFRLRDTEETTSSWIKHVSEQHAAASRAHAWAHERDSGHRSARADQRIREERYGRP